MSLKKRSSKWLKTKGPAYRNFAWQHGYGAFSIGQSNLPLLERYIAAQEEHHRSTTFQEEFRSFLLRYRVGYDEQYVWD